MRIAIPTNNPGGLEAARSGHFGQCDVFTVVELDENKAIATVENVDNVSHDSGGCMVPVNVLASAKVDVIVVSGIGGRPLQGFNKVGIDVYYADSETVATAAAVIDKMVAGELPIMRVDQACGGGADCHH
ncbi:MAG: NifB/NifX family molybdenum-iron cluster-binding protein [Desulfobulbaceae bacterium]|uniref:NifB/NifX family molybdenum-iron cluster-binding protein n=1 Tax=Candidatus Desulfatifera sulfidica TaxID=2841691 RepID=A0A8J6T9R9_9BACT|nr:NifB/NifX family molybdenum-iron cluster-binding protein [Candidatus Desulfatifera sulfidica]